MHLLLPDKPVVPPCALGCTVNEFDMISDRDSRGRGKINLLPLDKPVVPPCSFGSTVNQVDIISHRDSRGRGKDALTSA